VRYDLSMRMTWAVALVGVTACGRIGFATTDDASPPGDAVSSADSRSPVSPVRQVQSAAASCCGGGIAESLAFGSDVTTGDTLVAVIGWFSTSPAVTAQIATLTDTLGNVFTMIPSSYALETDVVGYGDGNFYSEIGYATTALGGADQITFALTTTVTYSLLYIVEATPCVFDVASGSGGRSTTPNAGTVTTTADGDLAVAITDMDQSISTSNVLSGGSGWTIESQGSAGTALFGQEYVVLAEAGMLTGDFDANGAAGQWMASMAAFKSIVPATDAGP
jgi:hypothetical protein